MGDKRKVGVLLDEKTLRRRYPDSNLASKICLGDEKSLRLPSRNIALNHHLGGGIKYGSILEIAGEESSGKTLMAMDFGVVTQSLGGVVLWDDAECTFDGKWAQAHGLKLDKMELLPFENEFEKVSDWMADMCVYYRSKLTNNEPILLVVDSLAVLEGGDAMEVAEQDTKAEMGKRSFNMGKLLRKRMKIFAKYGICVIFINQLRQKVGASLYEEKETTPLQQAMKFYASQRIFLFRAKRLKKGGQSKGKWVGNVVYIRTKKNKTSAPKDNIQAEVYFVEDDGKFGYHKYLGFEELLYKRNLAKKKGRAGILDKKGNKLAKNEEEFKHLIATDQKLRARFIKKLGINTISATREQIAALSYNLYPVKVSKKKADEDGEDS